MPIYRLSFQEIRGVVIDNDRQRAIEIASRGGELFATLIERAVSDYNLEPELCPPGVTTITPAYWRRNRTNHFLEVLPGGEAALCHLVPRQHNMTPAPYTRVDREIVAQDLTGGTSVHIPNDTPVFPVVGPVAEDPRLRLHEVIMYSREPKPA